MRLAKQRAYGIATDSSREEEIRALAHSHLYITESQVVPLLSNMGLRLEPVPGKGQCLPLALIQQAPVEGVHTPAHARRRVADYIIAMTVESHEQILPSLSWQHRHDRAKSYVHGHLDNNFAVYYCALAGAASLTVLTRCAGPDCAHPDATDAHLRAALLPIPGSKPTAPSVRVLFVGTNHWVPVFPARNPAPAPAGSLPRPQPDAPEGLEGPDEEKDCGLTPCGGAELDVGPARAPPTTQPGHTTTEAPPAPIWEGTGQPGCWARRLAPANMQEDWPKALSDLLDILEGTWGMAAPTLGGSWLAPGDGLRAEVNKHWPSPPGTTTRIMLSGQYNAARISHERRNLAVVRYVTPRATWPFLLDAATGSCVAQESEPTPICHMPHLSWSVVGCTAAKRLDTRVRLQTLLNSGANSAGRRQYMMEWVKAMEAKDTGNIVAYKARARCNRPPDHHSCPCCSRVGVESAAGGAQCGQLSIQVNKPYNTVRVRCVANNTTTTTRLGTADAAALFDTHVALPAERPSLWDNPYEDPDMPLEGPIPESELEDLPTVGPADPPESGEVPGKHTLVILSHNMDKTGKNMAGTLVCYAKEKSADIICLMEVENVAWSPLALMDAGYVMHRHGKCMILLKRSTAMRNVRPVAGQPKDTMVWRSGNHDTMAVTLDTPDGTLVVICAYVPPGVDALPQASVTDSKGRIAPSIESVTDQHDEAAALIRGHAHAIMVMDGNETENVHGRVQVHRNGRIVRSGKQRNSGIASMTMASLAGSGMVDNHRHLHATPGTDYPGHHQMTHEGAYKGMRVISKLDYSLSSKGVLARLAGCALDSRPKYWAREGKKRKSYHKMLVTTYDWDGLWAAEAPAPPTDGKLMGHKLKPYPNYAAMTPSKKELISQKISEWVKKRKKHFGNIFASKKTTPIQKATEALRMLKKIMLKVAKQTLGIVHPPKPRPDTTRREELWSSMVEHVDRCIHGRPMAESLLGGPHPTIHDDAFANTLRALEKACPHMDFPSNLASWRRWWNRRDVHRAEALLSVEDMALTDRLARKNPKRFYKQVTKPVASALIEALKVDGKIVASDVGIERALTGYLENLAGLPEQVSLPERRWKPEEEISDETSPPVHASSSHLAGLMNKIKEDEMLAALRDNTEDSSSGHDGISPGLLKLACLTTWTRHDEKGAEDYRHDAIQHRFHTYMTDPDYERKWNEGARDLPLPTKNPTTVKKKIEPAPTRRLLLRVINSFISAGDIPQCEKLGILTGLPKTEGLVMSTDKIRPITVGPAVSRLLHKIMARRLGAKIAQHDIIDRAQFAFLPGKDIHEPINTALTCYRDRRRRGGACYAVYYDMSKAYDTVRWSSIRSALERIGAPESFISFVISTLIGTRVRMRTNKKNHTTPEIELHQTIKQGCPLAPLLFAIIMDELHTDLRAKYKGYTLGDGTSVTSRGYCDDTQIISNSIQEIEAMNRTMHGFAEKHGLQVNATKTKITGINANGSPYDGQLFWPGAKDSDPFETVPPSKAIRYLGCYVAMNGTWDTQIKRMNSLVALTLSALRNKRWTLLQACSITKYVTGPKMEIGMRHAEIPRVTLERWDRQLAAALAARAGLSGASLHADSISLICNYVGLGNNHDLTKLTYTMELLTKRSELKAYHVQTLGKMVKEISTLAENGGHGLEKLAPYPGCRHLTPTLSKLALNGMWIRHNARSRIHVRPSVINRKARVSEKPMSYVCGGVHIPTRDTHELWGRHFDHLRSLAPLADKSEAPQGVKDVLRTTCRRKGNQRTYHHGDCLECTDANSQQIPLGQALTEGLKKSTCAKCVASWDPVLQMARALVRAVICTDGSTYTNLPSGAAMAFMTDSIREAELWETKGYFWNIAEENNYMAEMAAIHKALRSVPVSMDLTIHTDSLSSIMAIEAMQGAGSNMNFLRRSSRPYLIAISQALATRAAFGADTLIKHVSAHSGKRDRVSLGNASADRLAKWQGARRTPEGDRAHLDMEEWELPYTLCTTNSESVVSTTHGDVRAAAKTWFLDQALSRWACRESRGRLAREHPTTVKQVIKKTLWREPSSPAIALMLGALNEVTVRAKDESNEYTPEQCQACGTGAHRTVQHRLQECPCHTQTMNALDDEVAALTGYENDPDIPGPAPSALTEAGRDLALASLRVLAAGEKEHRADHGPWHCHYCGNFGVLSISCERHRACPRHHREHQTGGCVVCVEDKLRAKAGCRTVLLRACDNRLYKLDLLDDVQKIARLCLARHRGTRPPLRQRQPGELVNLLATLLPELAEAMGRGEEYHQAPMWRLASREALRTYSDLHYNPLTEAAPWDAVWMPRRTGEQHISGAPPTSRIDFLKNRYTWVCLAGDETAQAQVISDAAQAAVESTRPMRAVVLAARTATVHAAVATAGKTARTHVLATMARGSVSLRSSRRSAPSTDKPIHANTHHGNLQLVMIENKWAPGASTQSLESALRKSGVVEVRAPTTNIHPIPWGEKNSHPIETDVIKHRYPPCHRQSQTWYRCDLPNGWQRDGLVEQQAGAPRTKVRRNKHDDHDRVLAILGVPPPSLKGDIESHDQSGERTPQETTEKIIKIIVNKTLELYMRDEKFHKWRKKGKD